MNIPILNIYYLLCYAWNRLDEGKKALVSASDYNSLLELLSRVLINGCHQLFRRGLDSNYISKTELYRGIKGKIVFNESLNKNLFRNGMAICEIDNFEKNILVNQILKSTLKVIANATEVDKTIKKEATICYIKMHDVEDIESYPYVFSQVRIHRNNSHYDLLIRICKLIVENIVLDESNGKFHFKDFVRDEKVMAILFEDFVRNFYKKEQTEFKVYREDIYWDAVPIGSSSMHFLPKMQTDISLESDKRKIIIETKFYSQTLSQHYEKEKFYSKNLYQLYSYLRNSEFKKANQPLPVEGILLYPVVQTKLNESFKIANHHVSCKTIDLAQPWRLIHEELLKVID